MFIIFSTFFLFHLFFLLPLHLFYLLFLSLFFYSLFKRLSICLIHFILFNILYSYSPSVNLSSSFLCSFFLFYIILPNLFPLFLCSSLPTQFHPLQYPLLFLHPLFLLHLSHLIPLFLFPFSLPHTVLVSV